MCVTQKDASLFYVTVLFYLSVHTNTEGFIIFTAARKEFLESKDCGQFEETEEGKA